ncbi:MAG: hypothetical protein ACOC8K_06045, partial [Gemmatimonadota bacterium]
MTSMTGHRSTSPKIRWRGGVIAAMAALLLSIPVACGDDASAGPVLANSHDSASALAESVLRAIARDDPEALRSAMVTREEYRELFWPELPESDDMTFEAAWQMNEANSRNSRNGVMADFGGTEFELVSIEFAGGSEEYPSFT